MGVFQRQTISLFASVCNWRDLRPPPPACWYKPPLLCCLNVLWHVLLSGKRLNVSSRTSGSPPFSMGLKLLCNPRCIPLMCKCPIRTDPGILRPAAAPLWLARERVLGIQKNKPTFKILRNAWTKSAGLLLWNLFTLCTHRLHPGTLRQVRVHVISNKSL